MFRLIFLFVVLGAGLFVGTQFSGQQGYVLISIAENNRDERNDISGFRYRSTRRSFSA